MAPKVLAAMRLALDALYLEPKDGPAQWTDAQRAERVEARVRLRLALGDERPFPPPAESVMVGHVMGVQERVS